MFIDWKTLSWKDANSSCLELQIQYNKNKILQTLYLGVGETAQ